MRGCTVDERHCTECPVVERHSTECPVVERHCTECPVVEHHCTGVQLLEIVVWDVQLLNVTVRGCPVVENEVMLYIGGTVVIGNFGKGFRSVMGRQWLLVILGNELEV